MIILAPGALNEAFSAPPAAPAKSSPSRDSRFSAWLKAADPTTPTANTRGSTDNSYRNRIRFE